TAATAALLRIDVHGAKVAGTVADRSPAERNPTALWSIGGTLWQLSGQPPASTLVERDLRSGAAKQTFTLPGSNVQPAFGFGSIWVLDDTVVVSGPAAGTLAHAVVRIDELTGRAVRTIPLRGQVVSGRIATGNGAVWV